MGGAAAATRLAGSSANAHGNLASIIRSYVAAPTPTAIACRVPVARAARAARVRTWIDTNWYAGIIGSATIESDPAAARIMHGAAARETYKTGARCYVALLFAGCW